MQKVPIDTDALKALDTPTRWLLATALDEARQYVTDRLSRNAAGRIRLNADDEAELRRKRDIYLQIAQSIRG